MGLHDMPPINHHIMWDHGRIEVTETIMTLMILFLCIGQMLDQLWH